MIVENFHEAIAGVRKFLPQYLEENGIPLTGKNFPCPSPKHNDSTPSCILSRDKTHIHCFGCGIRWDIFDLAASLENKPAHGEPFITHLLVPLAKKYGILLQERDLTEEEVYRLQVYR